MTSRPALLALALLCVPVSSSLFGCAAGESVTLVIEAPARVRQAATSDDAELCGRLAVDITFDHRADGLPPLLENQPLVPVPGDPCSFMLPSSFEGAFPRGEYDVLVRFLAGEGAFVGSERCEAQDVGPVWVGAYVVEGLRFPDQALRLGEDTFLSRPADASRVPVPGVSFDLDGDGRDNLSEVAAGSEPCVANTPPLVTLSVDPSATDEEQPVTIRVSSADPAGVRHRLTLRLSHENGPNFGTEHITYRRFTSAPTNASFTPDLATADSQERWELVVEEADEDGAGALSMRLRFVPDEPFVGRVHVRASADDGSGTVLAEAPAAVLDVTDLDDPTRLLFEDEEGALVTLARIDFREVGPGVTPTERRFQIADDDLFDDVSQWSVELAAGSPAGMTLTQDLSFWSLSWSPDNDDVVAAPAGGHRLYLQFKDGSGSPVGVPQAYPVGISPLYNDPPAFGELGDLDLVLSGGPFLNKVLSFEMIDPDQATGQPSCAVEVHPTMGIACTDAWSEARCEVNGPRNGARWPFLVTLTPSETYFEDCGSQPSFELRLSLSDVPPAGAEPAEPKTVSTQASCDSGSPPGCVEHLQLYTAEVVSVATVTGGSAAPAAIGELTELRMDGVRGVGAFTAVDPAIGYTSRSVYLVDVDASPPRFVHEVPRTDLCEFHEGYLRVPHAVAVDEVNGRIVGFGRASASAANCSTDTSLIVFSLSTEPPYDVITWPKTEACGGACNSVSCGGAPAADGEGNVYLPCGGASGKLLRVDGHNQLSTHDIVGYNMNQNAWGTDVVDAPDGKSWFVWPDYDGIHFVDLSTWSDPVVASTLLTLPGWFGPRLEQGRADPWRKNYLYTYAANTDGVDLELYRVTFDTGTPVQEGPLLLGDHGKSTHGDRWVRFVLKPVAPGQPASEPDLVITGHINAATERFHVDLDSFTLVPAREPTDYWYLREVFESPDPRFYVGWVNLSSAGYEGLKLFPWDPTVPFGVQSIPGSLDWRQRYMRDWSVSYGAGVAALSDSEGPVRILRFEQAP